MIQRLLYVDICTFSPILINNNEISDEVITINKTFENIRSIVHNIKSKKTTIETLDSLDSLLHKYKDIILFLTR